MELMHCGWWYWKSGPAYPSLVHRQVLHGEKRTNHGKYITKKIFGCEEMKMEERIKTWVHAKEEKSPQGRTWLNRDLDNAGVDDNASGTSSGHILMVSLMEEALVKAMQNITEGLRLSLLWMTHDAFLIFADSIAERSDQTLKHL